MPAHAGHHLNQCLAALFGSLDAATLTEIERHGTWLELPSGAYLFDQGAPGDSLYIVVSGRLRAQVRVAGGGARTIGEIASGECVGEMTLFSDQPRTASVYAVRDSLLLRLAKEDFIKLGQRYPQLLFRISRIVVNRLSKTLAAQPPVPPPLSATNIALLATQPHLPLAAFAGRLAQALTAYGAVLALDSAQLDAYLGAPGSAQAPEHDPRHRRIMTWLNEQEERYRFIIYQADSAATPWTQRCLRQADKILLVADYHGAPQPGASEAQALGASHARRELVLLHRDSGGNLPTETQRFLAPRQVERHHHLGWDEAADYARLARFLSDRAVGLVLSGGGARGFAHIGAIRALREAGFAFDYIGGTSIGAVIGSLVARGLDDAALKSAARRAFLDERPLRDYALLPLVSLIKGRRLDRVCQRYFGASAIEDLWLNFFCISSDLITSTMVVHRYGPLWQAVRASVSLPGVLPPVATGQALLVDGGMVNNLPVDVMRQLGVAHLIAVDLKVEHDFKVLNGASPGAWQWLRQRLLPNGTGGPPGLMTIITKAALLSSEQKAAQDAKLVDLYLSPPVSQIGLLDFKAFERTIELGYVYTKERLRQLAPATLGLGR